MKVLYRGLLQMRSFTYMFVSLLIYLKQRLLNRNVMQVKRGKLSLTRYCLTKKREDAERRGVPTVPAHPYTTSTTSSSSLTSKRTPTPDPADYHVFTNLCPCKESFTSTSSWVMITTIANRDLSRPNTLLNTSGITCSSLSVS